MRSSLFASFTSKKPPLFINGIDILRRNVNNPQWSKSFLLEIPLMVKTTLIKPRNLCTDWDLFAIATEAIWWSQPNPKFRKTALKFPWAIHYSLEAQVSFLSAAVDQLILRQFFVMRKNLGNLSGLFLEQSDRSMYELLIWTLYVLKV